MRKKRIGIAGIVMGVAMCAVLSACGGNTPAGTGSSGAESSVQPGEETEQSEEEVTQTEAAQDGEEPEPQEPSEAETDLNQAEGESSVQVKTETFLSDNAEVQYVQVEGLDPAVGEKLNQELENFYLWQWHHGTEEEPDNTKYHGTAAYDVIGGRVLSVRRYLSALPDGAPYATEELSFQTFDLTTGESIDALNDKPLTEEMIQQFKLTSPGEGIPEELEEKAMQMLANFIASKGELYNFYLTEDSAALHIANDVHAEGDYFVYEIPAKALADVFVEPIRSAYGFGGGN